MVFEELVRQYWWALVIIALLTFFWIWSKLDFYTQRKLREFFSGLRLLLIIYIGVWYFWAKYGDTTTSMSAHVYMPVFGLLFLAGYNYLGKLRYRSQQVVCANFHGSYAKHPIYINGFVIFPIDSFNAGGLSWEYASRILVVREETIELFEDGAVSISRVAPCSIYELDPDVKNEIEKNGYLKGARQQIFYGWFDDINSVDWTEEQLDELEAGLQKDKLYDFLKTQLKVNNPTIKELYRLYRNTNKSYNRLLEEFDNTVEGVERGMEHQKRMKNAYLDKSDKVKETDMESE